MFYRGMGVRKGLMVCAWSETRDQEGQGEHCY